MQTDKIFHYTSVESLALILSTRKLRFTRLDRVDDVDESQTHEGVNFGQYFFVSCWTQEEEDNIAQWKMYGGDMAGVRIELPAYPFRKMLMEETSFCKFAKNEFGPLTTQELVGPAHFIMPPIGDWFAGPVQYVDDVRARYAAAVRRFDKDGKNTLTINAMYDLPRLKSNVWRFQSEYRFLLHAVPLKPSSLERAPGTLAADQIGNMGYGMMNNLDPGIDFIDVAMDEEAFERMVVTTGPLCGPGAAVCVDALLAKYASKATIRPSPLKGSMRKT